MNIARKILIGASTLAVMAGMASAAAAQATSATASTSATIIRPLAITKTADLQFGTIVRPASAGTVSLSTGGVISGVVQLNASTRSAAAFNVTGEGGQTFNISETATLGGPETLTLTLVKAATGGTISQTTSGGTGTLSGALGDTADGALTLSYGASFPITPTTATGAYTGSLVVTVNYN
jgi:hypothetical protein